MKKMRVNKDDEDSKLKGKLYLYANFDTWKEFKESFVSSLPLESNSNMSVISPMVEKIRLSRNEKNPQHMHSTWTPNLFIKLRSFLRIIKRYNMPLKLS